mgnify:FL=1
MIGISVAKRLRYAFHNSNTDHMDALMNNQAADAKLDCKYAQKVMDFLNEAGLPVSVVPGATGFVEDIALAKGSVQVDPKCLPSVMLHEAGHLAVIPSRYRHMMSGNLYKSMRQIFEIAEMNYMDPDDSLTRALLQSSDPEVTAWAWALGKHLSIPEKLIILDSQYDNTGKEIRLQIKARCYAGINGLSHGGFCVTRANPYRPLPVYPELAFWLQP